MFRTFFLTVGLVVAMLGVSCLFVDRVVLKLRGDKPAPAGVRALITGVSADRKQVIQPPEWAAYAMMSAGSVLSIYTFTLGGKGGGRRSKGKDD